MFMKLRNMVFLSAGVLVLMACAGPNPLLTTPMAMSEVTGFWGALLHGFFLPFNFIASLITDHISIYEVKNTGGWYDFGFILGMSLWKFMWYVKSEHF